MTQRERWAYEESLRIYRDNLAIVDTAREEGEEKGMKKGLIEGRKEGRIEGVAESVRAMRQNGLDNQTIARLLNKNINTINSID